MLATQNDERPFLGDFPLIFERSSPGREAHSLPACDVPAIRAERAIPRKYLRDDIPGFPEVAELAAQEWQAFQANAAAWAFFQATPPGYKKVVLHWVTTAKRAPTRASRLARLIQASGTGQRLR